MQVISKEISMKIATDIPTEIFYKIVKFLQQTHWKLKAEYDIFDKGIDFDLYQFVKNEEVILMAWTNWFEGEIKAPAEILNQIAEHFKLTLNYGNPEYLHDMEIIEKRKNFLKFYKF